MPVGATPSSPDGKTGEFKRVPTPAATKPSAVAVTAAESKAPDNRPSYPDAKTGVQAHHGSARWRDQARGCGVGPRLTERRTGEIKRVPVSAESKPAAPRRRTGSIAEHQPAG